MQVNRRQDIGFGGQQRNSRTVLQGTSQQGSVYQPIPADGKDACPIAAEGSGRQVSHHLL